MSRFQSLVIFTLLFSSFFLTNVAGQSCSKSNNNDVDGSNLKVIHSTPEHKCCGLCKKTPKCRAYAWNDFRGGTCWLKDSTQLFPKNGVRAGILSGADPGDGKCMMYDGQDVSGSNLAEVNNQPDTACCEICRQRCGCRAYAWNNYKGGTCWLKRSTDFFRKTGVKAGILSGVLGHDDKRHLENPNLRTQTYCDSELVKGGEIWLESVSNPGLWLNKDLGLATYYQAESFYLNTWGGQPVGDFQGPRNGHLQLKGQQSGLWWRAENGGGGDVQAKAKHASSWEAFEFDVLDEEIVAFKRRGNYVCLNGQKTGLRNTESTLTDDCKWRVEKQRATLDHKFRGVNIGAWLVLEKWMTPKMFEHRNAEDQYHLMEELGPTLAKQKMQQHLDSFLNLTTEFPWLRQQGLNTIRIPVGHWITKTEAQLRDDSQSRHLKSHSRITFDLPFPTESNGQQLGLQYLDKAMDAARQAKLDVWINLHGAIDSQNGWDHSGYVPPDHEPHWMDFWPANMDDTVKAVEFLVERYKNHEAFIGVGLVNEPKYTLDLKKLGDYYNAAYAAVRKHSKKALIWMSDSFRPKNLLSSTFIPKFSSKDNYGVLVDSHDYQAFIPEDKVLDMPGHVRKARVQWGNKYTRLSKYYMMSCGEWSLGIDPSAYAGMTSEEKNEWRKKFAQAQMEAFDKGQGWFFWSYKLDRPWDDWSFKKLVEIGVL